MSLFLIIGTLTLEDVLTWNWVGVALLNFVAQLLLKYIALTRTKRVSSLIMDGAIRFFILSFVISATQPFIELAAALESIKSISSMLL